MHTHTHTGEIMQGCVNASFLQEFKCIPHKPGHKSPLYIIAADTILSSISMNNENLNNTGSKNFCLFFLLFSLTGFPKSFSMSKNKHRGDNLDSKTKIK